MVELRNKNQNWKYVELQAKNKLNSSPDIDDHVLRAAPPGYFRTRRCRIMRVVVVVYTSTVHGKKFIFEEIPDSSEIEDMRKIR